MALTNMKTFKDFLKTFEDFLEDKWPAEGVLDDEMSDKFEAWLEQLDNEELIKSANEYGGEIEKHWKEVIKDMELQNKEDTTRVEYNGH